MAETHLLALFQIIARYGAIEQLGLHLIHSHQKLKADQIMLGEPLQAFNGFWTKPVDINAVEPEAIHAHILLADKDGFSAYEFRVG